ncbi:STAS domain-containing protein [Sporanaerobacter acetigenes]|uniref:STAS domain-containing protein n=1 Tax=Sporanaerobacter acetigenes TaxID=165813 RepID=UPI00104EE637|nr:anti-sigma factor antagonist [Sporanaerobacter acetigenes]
MRLILDTIEDILIIKFKGELDHHSTEEAREKIDIWYLDEGKKNIVFDLRELNFMDSSGIGLIMGRYKMCEENGGKVSIVSSSSNVIRILRMSGILKIIELYDSIENAINNSLEG